MLIFNETQKLKREQQKNSPSCYDLSQSRVVMEIEHTHTHIEKLFHSARLPFPCIQVSAHALVLFQFHHGDGGSFARDGCLNYLIINRLAYHHLGLPRVINRSTVITTLIIT